MIGTITGGDGRAAVADNELLEDELAQPPPLVRLPTDAKEAVNGDERREPKL